MQKKLLAVAVAGALFTPLAMAQSAVTISGTFKVGVDQIRINNACESADCSAYGTLPQTGFTGTGAPVFGAFAPTTRAGRNKSETRVTDHSSQIHFNVTEDLGGGLAGIAKLDVRFTPDQGTISAAGNTWVGIRSNTLGTLTFGRHDLHYGKTPDEVPVKGALQASSVSLMDYSVAGFLPIANTTRTPNVVRWDSPNWSGFNLTVAFSTNPGAAAESDLQNSTSAAVSNRERKGNAWNFNPSYTTSNWQVGYSFWRARNDAPGALPAGTTAATVPDSALLAGFPDQDSHFFYGFMRFGAFKVGAAYKRDSVESPLADTLGIGREVSKRTAWSIPVAWFAGPHTIAATYTRAAKDKGTLFQDDADDSSARMIAVAYSYDLSKRTSMSLTYATIRNAEGAAYDFFTNCGTGKAVGAFGSTGSCSHFGEDPRLLAATLRHTF